MATQSTRIISTEAEAVTLIAALKSSIPVIAFGYATDPAHAADTWQPTGYAVRQITVNGQLTGGNVGTLTDMAASMPGNYTFIMGPGGFPIPFSLESKPTDPPHMVGSSTGIEQGTDKTVFGGDINGAPGSAADLARQIIELASRIK